MALLLGLFCFVFFFLLYSENNYNVPTSVYKIEEWSYLEFTQI